MYESMDNNIPLYSIPHFNLTITGFDTRPTKKGLGFNVVDYYKICMIKININRSFGELYN